MISSYAHICDFDMKAVTYGPTKNIDGKVQVEIFRDCTSTAKQNRFTRVNLCKDAADPMVPLWDLDGLRDDQANPDKRGWAIKVTDEGTRAALEGLNESLVQEAMKRSKEWFKGKQLDEATIRDRVHPLLNKHAREDGEVDYVKIKIKCGKALYPTKIHIKQPDGSYDKNAGTVEDLTRDALVVPVLSWSSPMSVWFMAGGSKFGLSLLAEELFVTRGAEEEDAPKIRSSVPIKWSKRTAADALEDSEEVEGAGPKKAKSGEVTLEGEDLDGSGAM